MSVSPSHLDTGDVLLTIKAAPDVFEHGPTYADPHLMMVIVQESNDATYGGTLDGVITLWNRPADLERFQRLTVGRELKMIELKKENEYLRRLDLNGDGESGRSRSDP